MITLKELCDYTRVTRRTIQGYEEKGLLKSVSKNKMGHLLYESGSIEQVNLIRFYQSIGFSLREIKHFEEMDPVEFKKLMEEKIITLQAESILVKDKIKKIHSIIDAGTQFPWKE